MAELAKKMFVQKKNGLQETVKLYSAAVDIGDAGVVLLIDNTPVYAKYGELNAANSTSVRISLANGSIKALLSGV